MPTTRHKRIAKVKVTLTRRTIEALMPQARPWIAWDTDVTGFGVKVHPTGTKSFVLNYRSRSGGRRARNRRVVIGDANWVAPDHARRRARELLDRVAVGEDPVATRTAVRRLPTLAEAFEEYLDANPDRKEQTARFYRALMRNCFADWLARSLDNIVRREVEARFHLVSRGRGRTVGNHAMSLLRSVYRRPCVDFEGLRNPVELWLAGGGRYHRVVRRRISAPSEVLPRWRRGIEAEVIVPATRDIFWCGLYTGLRVSEVFGLSWDRVSLSRRLLRVDETKTGKPLLLPVTRQLAAVLERRRADCLGEPGVADRTRVRPRGWVFPSATSASGHVEELFHLYGRISRVAGTKFWFHGLRNAFISVAERELMLPRSLTKRLVNHARQTDVTEDYAADWTIRQLREPAQRIADRIEELMHAEVPEDGEWDGDEIPEGWWDDP
ncbi:MAG: integrase family protein [Acidobacteriota bacterium]|nr:integrase family protein [Acidobacteriota bacterium]